MHSTGHFYISFWFLILTVIGSEPITLHSSPQTSLDSLLQEYAFRELTYKPRTKTGIPYDAFVPPNLTGIKISALILTRYSLKWMGYGYFKEFFIPSGVMEDPYAKKLVMVYQNLGNWSTFYYPLPGYTYLTPVLGILAYDASDLYDEGIPELDILALEDPISISFPYVQPAPEGSLLKCVYFYSNRWIEFGDVTDGNVCLTKKQGHFSIIAEVKVTPSPSPSPSADEIAAPTPSPSADDNSHHKKISSKIWTVSLGVLIFALFGILFVVVKKFGLLELRQRVDDSATIAKPFLGNMEVSLQLEASTRPLPENDYVL